MTAVGIRQFEVGRALGHDCDVTFASSATTTDAPRSITVVPCRNRADFRRLLQCNDVLYTLGLNCDRFLDVARSGIRVVLDIYTPLAYEILESFPEVPNSLLSQMHRRVARWTNAQLARADFIVCTNERQRDMWLGALNAIGRLSPAETRRNPDCRKLIDVAPFGIPEHAPTRNGHPLRERFPKIGPRDFVLLWSSKILAWQDPVTLLRAMHLLREEEPDVRLVFMGTGTAPEEGKAEWFNPAALRTREAFATAKALQILNENVFFLTDRIPYRDVGGYYLDADAAVSTYPDSLETRFCLGSRILDYVWAGLPMVISGGELQREFVEERKLGFVVRPDDPRALADAIRQLKASVASGSFKVAFDVARRQLTWSHAARPIRAYCGSANARTRQTRRRLWSARLQSAEFTARSLAIRAHRLMLGVGSG